jgi:hypothetical protein
MPNNVPSVFHSMWRKREQFQVVRGTGCPCGELFDQRSKYMRFLLPTPSNGDLVVLDIDDGVVIS